MGGGYLRVAMSSIQGIGLSESLWDLERP